MGAERTFDYDELFQLIRDNPQASDSWLALQMTARERLERHDPSYIVRPSAIQSVRYRHRQELTEQGADMRLRKHAASKRSMPWSGVDNYADQKLDNLRTLTKIMRGEATNIRRERVNSALNMAKQLWQDKQVVDLDSKGRTYIRDARGDELDQEGNLISWWARWPGLTDPQWRRYSVEERAAASERFVDDRFEGYQAEPPAKMHHRTVAQRPEKGSRIVS